MLPVYFLSVAEAELLDAQDWYDERAVGLGDRFFAAVDALLPRIGDKPQQFRSPILISDFLISIGFEQIIPEA